MTTTRTREEQIEVANEIIRQLGGTKFRVMTGARDFMAIENGLAFKLSETMTKNKASRVRIVLDPTDTYTVSFWRYRRQKSPGKSPMTIISEHELVYFDGLEQLFTAETGLDTYL